MAKYRKKTVEVEAEQFLYGHPLPFQPDKACCLCTRGWYVVTAHQQMAFIVSGDWIIREPDGRGFYPCKPDIFEATYEPVETLDASEKRRLDGEVDADRKTAGDLR